MANNNTHIYTQERNWISRMVIIISVPFTFNVYWLKVAAIRTSTRVLWRNYVHVARERRADDEHAPDVYVCTLVETSPQNVFPERPLLTTRPSPRTFYTVVVCTARTLIQFPRRDALSEQLRTKWDRSRTIRTIASADKCVLSLWTVQILTVCTAVTSNRIVPRTFCFCRIVRQRPPTRISQMIDIPKHKKTLSPGLPRIYSIS